VLKRLTPLPANVPVERARDRTTLEQDPLPFAGIPLADGSGRLIPATVPQFRHGEPHADPPARSHVIDGEGREVDPGVPIPIHSEPPNVYAREATGARPVDWDDDQVTIVLASRPMQR
jgi:hypothetical protein